MKTITYEYDRMLRVGQLLNTIKITGVDQARAISEIGNILDSGKLGENVENPAKPDPSRQDIRKRIKPEGSDEHAVEQ